MLTIKINGREEKLNIGCRTFVPLDELLGLLKADSVTDIHFNGQTVTSHMLTHTTVKNGDVLKFSPYVQRS